MGFDFKKLLDSGNEAGNLVGEIVYDGARTSEAFLDTTHQFVGGGAPAISEASLAGQRRRFIGAELDEQQPSADSFEIDK